MRGAIPVTLYARPGCQLCDEVAEQLAAMTQRWPLRITTVNILDDADLYRRFRHAIPVVAIGDDLLRAPIAPAELAAAVARAGAER